MPDAPSVFLTKPRAEWLAENELAFALRDGFPVSEGHALVITKRVVPTWFDATPEEQLAVMALVREVKAQLDASLPLRPDGYNVGFNVGRAAGQTVMHLHVHVIPRWEGDVPDPRGGVRHVIPGKGNYLAATRIEQDRAAVLHDARATYRLKRGHALPDAGAPRAALVTGGLADPFVAHLRPLFRRAARIEIVAAFALESGVSLLGEELRLAVARGAHVRLVTGDYLDATQADALAALYALQCVTAADEDAPVGDEHTRPGSLEVRVVLMANLRGRGTSFHPKSWRFEAEDVGVAFVGSSNLSRTALLGGIEWNLRASRDERPEAYAEIVRAFEPLWSWGTPLTAEYVAAYTERERAARDALARIASETSDERQVGAFDSQEPGVAIPEPHALQREALAALAGARAQGRTRALVVLATGLGKTWLAAFDIEAFAKETGRFPRVLFLAHRRELLQQAARVLRLVAQRAGAPCEVQFAVGVREELVGAIVMASVQKLARPSRLARLAPSAFDYVVVDEAHHATARTYQRVLDHLEPRFVLGLTATPDRLDEASVEALFDDFVAYRASIERGIEERWLAPFQYFGLKDDVDYANIPWRAGRFDTEALSAAVQTQRRMDRLWQAWSAHPAQRTLVFCCSLGHARFVGRWLLARGVSVAVVHSGVDSDDRDVALRQLASGELQAICSIDLFNEGVDLPAIDRVVMLRPTESPVLFTQQLGRGLRVAGDKARLTVIDFVGNHRIFVERIGWLLGEELSLTPARLRAALQQVGPIELPAGCSVDVEMEAKQILEQLLARAQRTSPRAQRPLAVDEAAVAWMEGRAAQGEPRPTVSMLDAQGLDPKQLGPWFEWLGRHGWLAADEHAAMVTSGAWLAHLARTPMTKSFKMLTLLAWLTRRPLADGIDLDELVARARSLVLRDPLFAADVHGVKALGEHAADATPAQWTRYWRQNPIAAWTTSERGAVWFRIEGTRLATAFPLPEDEGARVALGAMTRELAEWRLLQYRRRTVR